MTDLTCKELVELVTDYLEVALTPEDKTNFERHLAGCEGCRTYVEQMRQTIQLTGKLAEADVPEPVRTKLSQVFREWKIGHGD